MVLCLRYYTCTYTFNKFLIYYYTRSGVMHTFVPDHCMTAWPHLTYLPTTWPHHDTTRTIMTSRQPRLYDYYVRMRNWNVWTYLNRAIDRYIWERKTWRQGARLSTPTLNILFSWGRYRSLPSFPFFDYLFPPISINPKRKVNPWQCNFPTGFSSQ